MLDPIQETQVLSKRHKFEVKSYYKVLTLPTNSSFPWNSIWTVKDPLTVAFFVLSGIG